MARSILEREDNVRVRPIRYGRFDLISFLLPGPTRRGPINRTKKILSLVISEARKNNGVVSVIAHSYGTYTISKILEEDRSIELKHLVLCGSIVDRDYDWPGTRGQISGHVLNDYGVMDVWPVVARWATVGYDATGTYGFYGNIVQDRIHNKRHSEFFDPNFIKYYWSSLISNGTVNKPIFEEGDVPKSPKFFEFFNFRLTWILGILLCFAAVQYLYDPGSDSSEVSENQVPVATASSEGAGPVVVPSFSPDKKVLPVGAPSDMDGIDWLTIAQKEVGVTEGPGELNNPRVIEYVKQARLPGALLVDSTAWVGGFAAWVMKAAGCDTPSQPAMALNWARWGVSLERPKAGAITVFRRKNSEFGGLVGFYISEDSTGINIIAGNVEHSVKAVRLERSQIVGYRWPNRCIK